MIWYKSEIVNWIIQEAPQVDEGSSVGQARYLSEYYDVG